jgi:hypothetical protein
MSISLIMSTSGCSINDYSTLACIVAGFIVSEILPHCPGVEANGILHFLTLLLKRLAESDCTSRPQVVNETSESGVQKKKSVRVTYTPRV